MLQIQIALELDFLRIYTVNQSSVDIDTTIRVNLNDAMTTHALVYFGAAEI
ncbi:MAG: hypothetical protein AAF939_20865 [Planctomycetota bacterium]